MPFTLFPRKGSWRRLLRHERTQIGSIVCMAMAATASVAFADTIDEALYQRFLDGIDRAQRTVEATALRAEYSITDESFRGDHSSPVVEQFECTLSKGFIQEITTDASGVRAVMAKNPDYAFRIAGSPNAPGYVVQFLAETGSESPDMANQIRLTEHGVYAIVFGCWHFGGHFLWDWPQLDGFNLKSIASHNTEGREGVRIEFDYVPSDSTQPVLKDVFLECDPANGWRIDRYGWSNGTSRVLAEITSTPAAGNMPSLPEKIVTTFSADSTGPPVFVRTAHIRILKTEPPDPAVFYLSYYGLDEPTFQTPWYTSGWVLLVLGGIAAAVGLVFLRRFQRRYR